MVYTVTLNDRVIRFPAAEELKWLDAMAAAQELSPFKTWEMRSMAFDQRARLDKPTITLLPLREVQLSLW